MMIVVAFLCRMVVFVALSVLSTFSSRGYELSMYSRIKVSTIQVFIFAGGLLLFATCRWIITAMHNVKMYRTLDELKATPEEDTGDMEDIALDVQQQEPVQVVSDANSQATHVSTSITFAGSKELRAHVWWVYYLGMLLYATIFCLDFTLLSVTFFFTLGIGLGWVFVTGARFQESVASTALRVLYIVLMSFMVGTYFATHTEILETNTQFWSRETITAIVVPLMTGFGWMRMPHVELVSTMRTAFFTCVLLCLPIILTIDLDQVQAEFAHSPPEILLYLLLLEPLLKFMAMYSIALSLQTGRRLEILVVMLVVVNLDDVLFKEMTSGIRGFTIFNMTLLTVVHVPCLFAVGTP
jgi:hypothetical protein